MKQVSSQEGDKMHNIDINKLQELAQGADPEQVEILEEAIRNIQIHQNFSKLFGKLVVYKSDPQSEFYEEDEIGGTFLVVSRVFEDEGENCVFVIKYPGYQTVTTIGGLKNRRLQFFQVNADQLEPLEDPHNDDSIMENHNDKHTLTSIEDYAAAPVGTIVDGYDGRTYKKLNSKEWGWLYPLDDGNLAWVRENDEHMFKTKGVVLRYGKSS